MSADSSFLEYSNSLGTQSKQREVWVVWRSAEHDITDD